MFAAKSSAWHVPFTPTYLCKLQYFSCGRDTEKRLITIALVESAIPAKIHGGDPRNICPVVARLRFHFPSSPRPTSFFLFFSSSFSFLFFLFHFSRGLLLFHGEIGRCSFIDSLQSTDLLFAYEWITIRTFLFSFFFFSFLFSTRWTLLQFSFAIPVKYFRRVGDAIFTYVCFHFSDSDLLFWFYIFPRESKIWVYGFVNIFFNLSNIIFLYFYFLQFSTKIYKNALFIVFI